MENNMNLQEIARKAAEARGEVDFFQEPTQASTSDIVSHKNPAEDLEESPAFIIGSAPKKNPEPTENPQQHHPFENDPVIQSAPKPVIPDMSADDMASTAEQAGYSDEEIEKLAPHLPEDKRNEISND